MKKVMKIAALILCAVMMTCLMAGCDETNRAKEENYTEEIKTQIRDMYGFPEVTNFFEYSQLKEIYELRDNPNLICYWYTSNMSTTEQHFLSLSRMAFTQTGSLLPQPGF